MNESCKAEPSGLGLGAAEGHVPICGAVEFGTLLGQTYAHTRSTFAAAVEHALYGCLVFTVGLGTYFYDGAGR